MSGGAPARAAIVARFVDLDAMEEAEAAALCDTAERDEAARRATPLLRRRAVASIAARRRVAGEVLGVEPRAVRLEVLADGRRRASAPGAGPLPLSVATAGAVGLVAIARPGSPELDVGADVEALAEVLPTPAFLARVASSAERAVLQGLDGEALARTVLRLWTRKEAYLKATGEGIGAGLAAVEVPLVPGVWAAAFEPRGDGRRWWCYELAAPADHAAALVVGPVDDDGGACTVEVLGP